jgi:hypothetical protein
MKKRTIIMIAAATAILVTLFATPLTITGKDPDVSRETSKDVTRETPAPDHRLEVWLSALEWCESQGLGTAINPEDLDGTPSYFWYQFKPSTFLGFGKQYGLLASTTKLEGILDREMKDYELTREIVRRMARDPEVNLYNQFPWCLKKLGPPPKATK